MKNKHIFTARCLSCITALTLAFSSFPDTHVFAEVEVLESAEDIPNVAEVPAIYIVTEFPEFKKNPDGTYTDSTIQQTYGSLSAVSGTAADDLGLPDDLTISGYWEVNGPEVPAEQFVLTDISWKLKSATGETYSEATPAGEYTFVPDLNAYVASQQAMGNTTFDEIKMEENVSLLELKVTITAEAPEETAP
ncbi:MAG: hypothetical protein Q4C50_08210, partial [Eubacteriales bacterium]|nr:hypothetical protein [Eubacteriales bacterium]